MKLISENILWEVIVKQAVLKALSVRGWRTCLEGHSILSCNRNQFFYRNL